MRWLLLCVAACGGSGASPVDGAIDVPSDAGNCFGAGLVKVCLQALPTAPMSIEGALDTATDARCVDEQGWCLIAGTDIQIGGVRASGPRPVVFVATGSITIDSLDAASRRTPGGFERGPGADSPTCVPAQTPSQNGGGPGGTFGGRGGDGGIGMLNSAESGLVVSTTTFRGGCAGTAAGAAGGPSGGAVYAIARVRIDAININVSGAPGLGAQTGGGGGGGSGGMIGLEAPAVSVMNVAFANGGGGGEGGANGNNGGNPIAATAPAIGGNGGAGGDGGTGSAGNTKTGAKGGDAASGGGGGGGGAGVIIVIPTQVTGGVLSPAPL